MVHPKELRYSPTDEWVRREGDRATIGITDYAQHELGDVVYLDLPEVGRKLKAEDLFGTVESVKAVADLISPGSGDTHPTLAMANYDPSSGNYDIQPLVDEAEDFQVAYGVDGADGSTLDGGSDPTAVSTTANSDEWVGNVAGEVDGNLGTPAAAIPRAGSVDFFFDTTVATSDTAPALAKARLHSLWVSLVVKSKDPEIRYSGPGSMGVVTLNSTAKSMSDPTIAGRPYQRRVQALAVNLRNFQ